MIKIENESVSSISRAIYSARNAMNSWDKSDSDLEKDIVGSNDLALAKRLCSAGTDHRKFMRMITVYVDIIAPLYFWKEFSTYKVGTVANSCSTMHKIHAKEFTLEDFSHEHLLSGKGFKLVYDDCNPDREVDFHLKMASHQLLELIINTLNYYRKIFLETKDKKYWWQLIQLLPSSYNQRRTVMLNYEVLANIYKSRCNHKLNEWHTFCDWIERLPYSGLITGKEKNESIRDLQNRE